MNYELKFVYLKPTGLPPLNIKSDNFHLWIAAIDEKLNEKNYIVPGLEDAGDLAYGSKL